MKIVVYNYHDQYALSRNEVEKLIGVLTREYWMKLQELHLAHSHPNKVEAFEYDEVRKIGYLIVPVKQKTEEARLNAIRSLLLGLARIRGRSRFFYALRPNEEKEYESFINAWLPYCEAALQKNG